MGNLFMKKQSFKGRIFVLLTVSIGILWLVMCSTEQLPEVSYENGAVVSVRDIASQVGVDIMKQGGNAVDAAVAVSFALAVTSSSNGNIGGGGFLVIRWPDGKATTIDCREKAPHKATRNMYVGEDSKVDRTILRRSGLASGVPGTVAGTLMALEKYGTMSLEDVIQPAIMLADTGFFLTQDLGGERNNFDLFPSTAAIFLKPDGSRWTKGERFVQKDLARTLRIISEKGQDGFYKGEIADMLVNTVKKHGGIIDHKDLEEYEPEERQPVKGTYRGYDIISMAPPSSGGTCLIEILNILERYDIESLGPNTPETVHLMTEAMRRTYADRYEYLGDPDYTENPVGVLISKDYADKRSGDIKLNAATPSSDITNGDVVGIPKESDETTHYSVIDKDGMAVSVTTTLEGGYGSYLVIEGAGFFMNNEMGDFNTNPDNADTYGRFGTEANSILGGKRMLSSMTPTIVVKDGKPIIVVGAAGGQTIITKVLHSILNIIDHKMTAKDAFGAPGFHHGWYPDRIGRSSAWSEETVKKLEELGHTISNRGNTSAKGIFIDPITGYYKANPEGAVGY